MVRNMKKGEGRTIKNPITGKSYPVFERKTPKATLENIKTLWEPSERKSGKKYW